MPTAERKRTAGSTPQVHEGHGFTKKKNQIVAWEAIVDFLDEYMPAKSTE